MHQIFSENLINSEIYYYQKPLERARDAAYRSSAA